MPFATLLRCAGPVTPFALAGLSATSHAQPKGNTMSGLVGKPFSATREKRLAVGWSPEETNLTTAKGAAKRERVAASDPQVHGAGGSCPSTQQAKR